MSVAVSVVIIAKDFRSHLGPLFESLDLQSLPTSAFEVVLVDLGSADGTVERLRQLTTHRPNVRLLELEGPDPDASSWLPACSGDYVLRLRPDQVLLPEALERLHSLAEQQDLDAVSARVSQRGAPVAQLFTSDQTQVADELVPAALAGDAVLIRHSLLDVAADPDTDALRTPTRVGILASYPACVQPPAAAGLDDSPGGSGGGGSVEPRTLRQDQPACEWVDGRLRLSVSVLLSGSSPDQQAVRALAVLRHTTSGMSYLLPAEVQVQTGAENTASEDSSESHRSAGLRCAVSLEVDVLSAAFGAALPHGVYEVDVQLLGLDEEPAPLTVAWAACSPAIIDELIVVPSPTLSKTLQLDVGPTTWPLVTGVDASNGLVTETAAGSRMVLQLPHVHVSGAGAISGQIALDSLRLQAQIITDGSSARLESFVSGLFGTPRLSTQFGDTPLKPSGLALQVSGLGAMTVVKEKPAPKKPAAAAPPPAKPPAKKATAKKAPAKKTTAKKAAAKNPTAKKTAATPGGKKGGAKPGAGPVKKAAPSGPSSTVQLVRHALPKSLDPLVKRVAKNPLARRLYRTASGLR